MGSRSMKMTWRILYSVLATLAAKNLWLLGQIWKSLDARYRSPATIVCLPSPPPRRCST